MKKRITSMEGAKRCCCLLLLAACSIVPLFAQDAQMFTVKGRVTDADSGIPLAGVTVAVKGQNQATQSDAAGAYQLTASQGDVLAFQFLGYESKEIEVVGATLDARLSPTVSHLDEVVVVGYNTVRKADLTGAVASIGSEQVRQIGRAHV